MRIAPRTVSVHCLHRTTFDPHGVIIMGGVRAVGHDGRHISESTIAGAHIRTSRTGGGDELYDGTAPDGPPVIPTEPHGCPFQDTQRNASECSQSYQPLTPQLSPPLRPPWAGDSPRPLRLAPMGAPKDCVRQRTLQVDEPMLN
jgi:hypothetical protein